MTLSSVRHIIGSGVIPTVRIGRKVLVNYDRFISYLNTPAVEAHSAQQGQIRRIG